MIYLEHRFAGTSEIDTLFKIFESKGTPDFKTTEVYPDVGDLEYVTSQFKLVFPQFPQPTNIYDSFPQPKHINEALPMDLRIVMEEMTDLNPL